MRNDFLTGRQSAEKRKKCPRINFTHFFLTILGRSMSRLVSSSERNTSSWAGKRKHFPLFYPDRKTGQWIIIELKNDNTFRACIDNDCSYFLFFLVLLKTTTFIFSLSHFHFWSLLTAPLQKKFFSLPFFKTLLTDFQLSPWSLAGHYNCI